MAIHSVELPPGVVAHGLADAEQLAGVMAGRVADVLRSALDTRGVACLVVSGGRSPVAFLECLADQALDWARVTVTLADERWVPEEHPDSNAGLVRRHLLRGHAAQAHFIGLYRPAESLEAAARQVDVALVGLPRPIQRLTLTLPLLATARLQLLQIQGEAKLATLRAALEGDDPRQMPIRAFLRPPLEIYWCP